ncbi:hypothetical protein [Moorena sp. SIOASIH]|uniref:hypothetical protein n=1 Tax=Moorena sp. SIOASIH TaxID=2607817 RepID=UPI0025CFE91F|nr:hypothetical protein [Moorena sp. SIOASIH]
MGSPGSPDDLFMDGGGLDPNRRSQFDPLDSRSSRGSANMLKASNVGYNVGFTMLGLTSMAKRPRYANGCYIPLIQAALAVGQDDSIYLRQGDLTVHRISIVWCDWLWCIEHGPYLW